MREFVAVSAILGGLIELMAAIGGPGLAGVGMETGQPAPGMEAGPLLVGLAGAAVSVACGVLVLAGRSGQLWGIALIATAAVGASVVGPSTGWYTLGAGFTLLAGAMALFVRRRRRGAG